MKKVLALVLALALVFTLSVSAFAAETTPAANLKAALKEAGLGDFTGLVDGLTEAQVKTINANQAELRNVYYWLQEDLKAAKTESDALAAVSNAVNWAKSIVGDAVSVSNIKATVTADKIVVTATITAGKVSAEAKATIVDGKVTISGSTGSPTGAKTGDNGMTVALVSLIAAAGVLALAARKSRCIA